jgi:hypothetical protein
MNNTFILRAGLVCPEPDPMSVANTQHNRKLKNNRVVIGKNSNEGARCFYGNARGVNAMIRSIFNRTYGIRRWTGYRHRQRHS